MFKNISLSLSGLIFVIVIAVMYFKKKRYISVENNIYRILIIWTIALLILEIACDSIISYRAQLPLLTETLCRLYILGDAAWFVLLIAYMEAFLVPEKYKDVLDVFSQKSMLFLVIISSVLFFISCFLELTYTSASSGEFNVIGGKAVFVLYAVFAVVCVLIVRVLSKNLDRVTLIKRIPILSYLVLFTIMKIFQYIYTDVNDLGFLFAFCIVAMYFTIENQDIKLVSELEIARKKAEDADKSKTEFLSKMSHEIRTPMNAIMGFSENLIKSDTLDEKETIEDVRNIYSAGKNLLEIINNILFFSRVESGKEKVENLEYSLLDIVLELDSFVGAKIDNSNFTFNINLDENIPLKYIGDKQKIYRMLVNLINNSINFTSNGIIEVNITCDEEEDNMCNLKFEIKDTGIGMTEEYLNILSNEFSTPEELNSNIKGMGLGLSIVKKIVNMLDAKITFDSEYGTGSVFSVIITQKKVGNDKIKDFKTVSNIDSEKSDYFDCSNLKLLIVEDNPLNRKVSEKLLKPYNIKIVFSNNGKECINRIKCGEEYDLMLLDNMMPELDGIQTIRILKKIKEKRLPPIIIMTANMVPELKMVYKKEGFDDYLDKPIDIKELNKLMIKYLKNKNRRK